MSELQLALPGLLSESTVEWVWCEESEDVSATAGFVHTTVMRDEVLAALAPRAGGVYVDVTLGAGGHAEAILAAAPGARVVGIDRDPEAISASRSRLASYGERFSAAYATFGTIADRLRDLGIDSVDGVCADLGVSSPQLDDPCRGMSFRREGPIDMRMDKESGETALELIQRLDDEELANVIYRYGDEHRSRRIARSIRRAVDEGDLVTTLDLRRAIVRAVGPVRVGGVDPATRTFQALRIAVNQELDELAALLGSLPQILASGGVAAVLSFHSLEDRLVKRAFQDKAVWQAMWKKPRAASEEETTMNARARSAKLRAAYRISPVGP